MLGGSWFGTGVDNLPAVGGVGCALAVSGGGGGACPGGTCSIGCAAGGVVPGICPKRRLGVTGEAACHGGIGVWCMLFAGAGGVGCTVGWAAVAVVVPGWGAVASADAASVEALLPCMAGKGAPGDAGSVVA